MVMKPEVKDRIMSHEHPVTAAIYNSKFNQVHLENDMIVYTRRVILFSYVKLFNRAAWTLISIYLNCFIARFNVAIFEIHSLQFSNFICAEQKENYMPMSLPSGGLGIDYCLA